MKRTLLRIGSLCALVSVLSVVSFAGQRLTKIQLNGPERIALDSNGNLYVYESYGRRIVRLSLKDDKADVVAGNGKECCYREGALARNTAIYNVYSLAVDPDRNIYMGGRNALDYAFVRVIDAKSGRIRTIANGRMPSPATGVESAQADLSDPEGLAVIPGGGLLVTASQSDLVAELTTTSACFAGGRGSIRSGQKPDCKVNADFSLPGALAIDSNRNLYVADYFGNRVFRINPVQAKVSVVAGNGGKASSGDGGPAVEAGISYPFAIALDHEENLYIVENGGGTVRKVDAKTGVISTIAGTGKLGFSGDGGPARNADMNPSGIVVDQEGNLCVADTSANRIRVVDKMGVIRTVAGNGLPKRKPHSE